MELITKTEKDSKIWFPRQEERVNEVITKQPAGPPGTGVGESKVLSTRSLGSSALGRLKKMKQMKKIMKIMKMMEIMKMIQVIL